MPSSADIPLIDSHERDFRPPQLVLKNFREQVNDVRKDLEELQISFNSLNYSQRSLLTERTSSIVSFSTVQVREYNVTMGDYRSGPEECPLTLAWEHGPSRTYDIDTFSKKRQNRNPLERLPLHKRQDRLRAMGFFKEEISQTSRKQQRIQKLALNCACRHPQCSSFHACTIPREGAPLYHHRLKKFQTEEDCVFAMEKIIKAGKNFKTASSIEKLIRSKNTKSAIAA